MVTSGGRQAGAQISEVTPKEPPWRHLATRVLKFDFHLIALPTNEFPQPEPGETADKKTARCRDTRPPKTAGVAHSPQPWLARAASKGNSNKRVALGSFFQKTLHSRSKESLNNGMIPTETRTTLLQVLDGRADHASFVSISSQALALLQESRYTFFNTAS